MGSHEKYLKHSDEEEMEENESEEPRELLRVGVDETHIITVVTDPTSIMPDAVKVFINRPTA